ncbi:MAG: hypothetical protein KGL53_14445 [Elusimicrobia bacterium]|nr:hypothetical protein [Elusimicrobiota bacterium]
MTCPSCSASAPEGAEECPACGVIFSKWHAKAEREASEGPPPALLKPRPRPRNYGYGLVALLAVAAASGGAYVLYQKSLPAPVHDDGKPVYDPTPYRAQIYALEKALYAPGAPAKTDADAVKNLCIQIAELLQSEHSQNPYVHLAVDDLLIFAGEVSDDSQQAKLTAASRKAWIDSWEALRAKRFSRAPWFHAAAAAAQQ